MNLTIARPALVKALNNVRSAASSRGSLPILANVLLKAKGKELALTCTDQEITIATTAEATVNEAGATSVRVELLTNLCRSFSGDNVELTALKNDLKIECGEARYKLGSLPSEDFPPTPKFKDPINFDLPQHIVHRLLAETEFCQGSDINRPMLNGSYLELNGSLSMAACDGKRIAAEQSEIAGKLPKTTCILPPKTTRELLRLLHPAPPAEDDKEAPLGVSVIISEGNAQFHFPDTVLTTRLLEGSYPNYRQVIPETLDLIPIGRTTLLSTLERVGLIASQCTLEISGQSLTVRGTGNKEIPGEAVESLLIPKVKKDQEVAFETSYLISALQAIKDDEVLLHLQSKSPAVIKVASRPWVCVVAAIIPKEKEKEKEPAKDTKK